jgi:UPF0716 protein FxsA
MFVLALIAWVAAEVFALIEVGHAIGWPAAVLALLATSLVGWQLLRLQGRAALERVSRAVAQQRPPGPAAIDGGLGFIGALLLVIPGFVTDALGLLLLAPPTRALTRRWLSRHYRGRVMRMMATTGRFAPRERGPRPGDVDSTAVEEDQGELPR